VWFGISVWSQMPNESIKSLRCILSYTVNYIAFAEVSNDLGRFHADTVAYKSIWYVQYVAWLQAIESYLQ
jgi:hypothetical protein